MAELQTKPGSNHFVRGYWLVRESDKQRFFISEKVNLGALERLCDRVLSDAVGWAYWIDYCYGLDVKGCVQWENLDLQDHFEAVMMA